MKKAALIFILVTLCLHTAAGKEKRMELRARRYTYTPSIITVNRGDILVLTLISEDVTHGFFLDGYDISAYAHPGEPREIVIRAKKPGKFIFRCSSTCGDFHPYMVGYLKVLPNTNLLAGVSGVVILGLLSIFLTGLLKRGPKKKLFG
ncbi:MAG: cupredoxin domain-containing protein, partial [Spirochaetota bacterium]